MARPETGTASTRRSHDRCSRPSAFAAGSTCNDVAGQFKQHGSSNRLCGHHERKGQSGPTYARTRGHPLAVSPAKSKSPIGTFYRGRRTARSPTCSESRRRRSRATWSPRRNFVLILGPRSVGQSDGLGSRLAELRAERRSDVEEQPLDSYGSYHASVRGIIAHAKRPGSRRSRRWAPISCAPPSVPQVTDFCRTACARGVITTLSQDCTVKLTHLL